MPSLVYVMGFIVGVLFVLIIVLLMKKVFTKNGLYDKCEPDERQILARGSAYKIGFYTMLTWNVLCYVLHSMDFLKGKWLGDVCFLGLFIGVMVYAIVCIIKDAYLGTAKNPGKVLLGLVIIGVINFGLGIGDCLRTLQAKGSDYSFRYNIICGVMLLIVAAVQGIKMWYNHCHEE